MELVSNPSWKTIITRVRISPYLVHPSKKHLKSFWPVERILVQHIFIVKRLSDCQDAAVMTITTTIFGNIHIWMQFFVSFRLQRSTLSFSNYYGVQYGKRTIESINGTHAKHYLWRLPPLQAETTKGKLSRVKFIILLVIF